MITKEKQLRIGVFGSAFVWSKEAENLASIIGETIVEQGAIVVTGATTGLPYLAGKSAIQKGGFVLGISPAHDPKEHVEKYQKPIDGCSVIIWTGSGYTGRNYLNLRNCDGAIFIGGETGTLEEFCVANYEGKVIGILEGSGGVSDKIRDIMSVCPTNHGAIIEYNSNPQKLVLKVINNLKKE